MPGNQLSWTVTADRVGIAASTLCFLHCLATPVLLSLSAVSMHFLPSEERTHRALAIGVTLIGVMALGFGYSRHRRKTSLALAGLGVTLIFLGAFFGNRLPFHWQEVVITLAGSCFMIVAHRLNHTFCNSCKSC